MFYMNEYISRVNFPHKWANANMEQIMAGVVLVLNEQVYDLKISINIFENSLQCPNPLLVPHSSRKKCLDALTDFHTSKADLWANDIIAQLS